MDVGTLRAELEKHLEKNPHEDAPGGFRDRFEAAAELLQAGDTEIPKSALEEELQQIHDEAAAAAKAGEASSGRGEAVAPPRADPPPPRAAAPDDPRPPAAEADARAGFPALWLGIGAGLVALALGYFYFR